MIQARISEKEFLIAFSYADRDRAKRIRNYRWDPIEKVWRYPLSQRTYQELLREFDSDELEFVGEVSRLAEWSRSAQLSIELESIVDSFPDPDDDLPGSEEYRFICSLYEMVRSHGFTMQSYDDLLRFLQECVAERASEAGAETRVAIQNAQLTAALAELTLLKQGYKNDDENFETLLLNAAWGGEAIPRPDFLASFKFGSDGVIKAAEWLARTLRAILRKAPNSTESLYDLIREAADAQIFSKDAYRLCETLRHQRNRFGHDRINPGETLQHALLSLIAFSLVYRELYLQLPSS